MLSGHRFFWLSVAAGWLGLWAGCIPSLHPVYTRESLVVDSGLVGVWQNDRGDQFWEFQSGPEQNYLLTITDRNHPPATFVAHRTRIGQDFVLDVYPREQEHDLPPVLAAHVIPIHTLYRIRREGDVVELQSLDGRWLEGYLAQHPEALAHTRVQENRLLLTASTEQLRKFLQDVMDNDQAWAKAYRLSRRP